MHKKVSLTGVKPTGSPHIGNLLGAIKPALELAEEYDAFYFIADYHALNSIKKPDDLRAMTYEVAGAWLAFGLDPEKVIFYRQSQVPEIFELAAVLAAFTAKGLMNRAHAYKAQVAENEKNARDPDYGINMGLFTYPLLMAADILAFDADVVPVGKDQVQHLEMCIDIAQVINHNYQREVLKIPSFYVREETQVVYGLDGRKMSKSYQNTIPLFLTAKALRKLIMRIKTNSQGVEESKDPDSCNIFRIYQLFANSEEQVALKDRYHAGGMGWGDAKEALYEMLDGYLSPYRQRYDELMAERSYIDRVLIEGAAKARQVASRRLDSVRKALGINQ